MMHVVQLAHAKINLALAVGPPRKGDGFHPICSWFAPINLADELRIEQLDTGAASRYAIDWAPDAPRPSPIDWPLESDLAVRAHRLMEQEVGRALPIAIRLTKRIPVGGGLGGGSSDAAAMLRALSRLFRLNIAAPRLRAIALTLGSDVPYFLLDPLTPAVVEGVGESIVPTPPIEGALILIFPPFGCPTGAVYRALDALKPSPMRSAAIHTLAFAAPNSESFFNNLAAAAEQVAPQLTHVRATAARVLGRPVHVTGSGSTLFALCHSHDECRDLIAALRDALPDCSAAASCFRFSRD